MADSRTGNSIKNSTATFIGRILSVMMEFVLRTVLIRFLGINYGGISTLFTDVLQVLSLVELGLGGAIIYALYKPLAENDNRTISALMAFYRKAYNTIAIVIFVLGLCLVPALDYIVKDIPDVKEDIRLIFMLYIMASASSYLVIYKETLIKASQMSRVVVMIETIVKVVFMAIETLMLLIFHQYIAYLVLRIVSTLVRNVLISREVKKRFPDVDFKSKERLLPEQRKRLSKDIGALALYKVSGVVLNGTDSIIISAFLGTGIVGVIGQYRMISSFICSLSNNIWVSVLPSVGNLAVVKDPDKQYRVFSNIIFGAFMFGTFCSVCVFILINPAVAIWVGEKNIVSMDVVAAIAFNVYLLLTALPFQTFRDANGLFVQGKFRPVLMAVINIGLSLLLVKRFGLFGVLFATPFARLVTQSWFDPYIVFKHVFHRKPGAFYIEYLKQIIVTVICALVSWLIVSRITISNLILTLIVDMIICIPVTAVIYYIIYRNNPDFIRTIKNSKKIFLRIVNRIKGRSR